MRSAVAVAGDPTPGRPGELLDVFALSSGSNYWPCSDGSVAFLCDTDPSGGQGIWHGSPGSLRPVLIVGDAAPLVPGAVVASFPALQLVANGKGAVLARARFEGGGVTAADDSALWLSKPGEPEVLVAREGDQAPGTEPGTSFDDFISEEFSMNRHEDICFTNRIKSGRSLPGISRSSRQASMWTGEAERKESGSMRKGLEPPLSPNWAIRLRDCPGKASRPSGPRRSMHPAWWSSTREPTWGRTGSGFGGTAPCIRWSWRADCSP